MKEVSGINESPRKGWFDGMTIPKHPSDQQMMYITCNRLIDDDHMGTLHY